jgi:hypothetical protein
MNLRDIETDKRWTELPPHHRHILIGEVIDAMIYHSEAVTEVIALLQTFRERGFVRSIILPELPTNKTNNDERNTSN